MAVVIGGSVRRHVQAFADALGERFDVSHISTYPGHDPSIDLALDVFPANREVGDAIAEWAIENWERYGVDYQIWWQRIWNPEISRSWRQMADRGSVTANHKDHLHFSFEPSAPEGAEEDEMTPAQAHQLNAVEAMCHEIKNRTAAIKEDVDKLKLTGGAVDLDALAKRVADEIYARLKQ